MTTDYGKVSSWNELLHMNLAYLHGDHTSTFYRDTPFFDDKYCYGTYKLEKDLIRLHWVHGILTYESQNSLRAPHKMQRGYLKFVCPKYEALYRRLLEDTRIYTFVREINADGTELMEHNCLPQIPLTMPFGDVFDVHQYEDDDAVPELLERSRGRSNLQSLFLDTDHIFICMRDFPGTEKTPLEITTCLLEALEG